MPRVSEKGQGLWGYALIMACVAIVIIAAVTILAPMFASLDQSASILSDSPVVGYEKVAPSLIGPEVSGDDSVTIRYGCHLIYISSSYDLKAATQYPHVDELSVARVDATHYRFCSQVPAAKVTIQIEYIKK